MKNLSGYPYFEIEFTKDGKTYSETEEKELLSFLGGTGSLDLLVLSHGWNNDMSEARELYRKFLSVLKPELERSGRGNKNFAVVGVLWPSKKFADKELNPRGGAASFQQTDEIKPLMQQLENLKDFFDGERANDILDQAKENAKSLKDSDAQANFVRQMNELFQSAVVPEPVQANEDEIFSFDVSQPQLVLQNLEEIDSENYQMGEGGAASANISGGAAGLGDMFGSVYDGARNLLNYVTYYQMKERAGKVGALGLNPLLKKIKQKNGQLKLHLIGHSFGGRLVTAAVAGIDSNAATEVNSLTLLQSAFSHYGFAEKYDKKNDGFFRRVVKKVKGPILISHTHNDKAVGIAYAIASRIAKQVGAALGDAEDKFGGMGANGAQKTPEAINEIALLPESNYKFTDGKIYNLNGDLCIKSHSDVCVEEVARAIMTLIGKNK